MEPKYDNPIIKINNDYVKLIDNMYYLYINNLEQSSYNKYTYNSNYGYFNALFRYINDNNLKGRVLSLGFGLGCIPLNLSKNNKINIIDCVDINKNTYIFFNSLIKNPSNKINYYLTDANDYLLYNDKKYDIIIDDVFTKKKLLLDCNLIINNLNKNGYFIANIHYMKDVKILKLKLKRYFKKIEIEFCNELLFIGKEFIG